MDGWMEDRGIIVLINARFMSVCELSMNCKIHIWDGACYYQP